MELCATLEDTWVHRLEIIFDTLLHFCETIPNAIYTGVRKHDERAAASLHSGINFSDPRDDHQIHQQFRAIPV